METDSDQFEALRIAGLADWAGDFAFSRETYDKYQKKTVPFKEPLGNLADFLNDYSARRRNSMMESERVWRREIKKAQPPPPVADAIGGLRFVVHQISGGDFLCRAYPTSPANADALVEQALRLTASFESDQLACVYRKESHAVRIRGVVDSLVIDGTFDEFALTELDGLWIGRGDPPEAKVIVDSFGSVLSPFAIGDAL